MKFTCPHCQQPLEADDNLAGVAVECPACGKEFAIQSDFSVEAMPSPATIPMAANVPDAESVQRSMPTQETVTQPPAETPPSEPEHAPKKSPNFRVVSRGTSDEQTDIKREFSVNSQTVQCPNCGWQFRVEISEMGIYTDCPTCGKHFRIHGEAVGSEQEACVSMAVPLVFQSIVLAWTAFSTLRAVLDADVDEAEVLAWVFAVPAILSVVFSTLLHYKCWHAIPKAFARISAGKAVGWLFVPFFNLFWVFPSIFGLGNDSEMLARHKKLKGAMPLKGLGLALAILTCISIALMMGEYLYLLSDHIKDVLEDREFYRSMNMSPSIDMKFYVVILLLVWAIRGIPVVGLLVLLAQFVVWLLFYRGVTRVVNAIASTPANAPLQ